MNWFLELVKNIFEFFVDMSKVPFAKKIPEPITFPYHVEIPTPRERLYTIAKAELGKDASPKDKAPDDLGCADSVNEVYYKAFGRYICVPGILTTHLYNAMRGAPEFFEAVLEPLPGDIIISPTGYGNGKIPNGHVGIVGKYGIMSNDSYDGIWKQNYTIDSWNKRYKNQGGFPVFFFRCV